MSCSFDRNTLASLADRATYYAAKIREHGVDMCFVKEDWVARNCNPVDRDVHERYLVEFARESLISADPSLILFDDRAHCKSEYLNELKRVRLETYGPVEHLKSDPESCHLVELSPCLRHMRGSTAAKDWSGHQHDVRRRADIDRIKSRGVESPHFGDRKALGRWAANVMAEELPGVEAVVEQLPWETEDRYCAAIRYAGPYSLIVSPLVQIEDVSDPDEAPEIYGNVAVHAFVTRRMAGSLSEAGRELFTSLRLSSVLPGGYADVGWFDNPSDFAPLVQIWAVAMNLVVADVLEILRRAPE